MKPIYIERNYSRNLGSDIHYAIITIEECSEDEYSVEEYLKEFNCADQDIEFSEKTSGKFRVEYGSNWKGTEEVVFADTVDESLVALKRMEHQYCEGMSSLGKPLEEYIINNEEIPTNEIVK